MRLNHKRIGLLCGRAARARARVLKLTSARLDFLTTLLQHERIQVSIASILCVTEPVVSRMVRELEKQGWVQRRRHPLDRRCKIVSISAYGREQLEPFLDAQNHIDPSGEQSAQCDGEYVWLSDWHENLTSTGLHLWPPTVHTADGLFRRMQLWNKRVTYDAVFNWWSDHPDHPLRVPRLLSPLVAGTPSPAAAASA